MKNLILPIVVITLFASCAQIRDPALLKYEACVAQVDQRVARGEIAEVEADNLKMHAYQDYQAVRRREEKQLAPDSDTDFLKSQNQEINYELRQGR